jgi:hypothetical protein
MKRLVIAVSVVGFVVFAGGCGSSKLQLKYKDKGPAEWVGLAKSSRLQQDQDEALNALRSMSRLRLRAIEAHDLDNWEAGIHDIKTVLVALVTNRDADWRVRLTALAILADHALPNDADLVPVFVDQLMKWPFGLDAARGLATIGPAAKEAIPALLAACDNESRINEGHLLFSRPSVILLQHFVRALKAIDPAAAKKAVPVLVAVFTAQCEKNYDDTHLYLTGIAETLKEIDAGAVAQVVPVLVKALLRERAWPQPSGNLLPALGSALRHIDPAAAKKAVPKLLDAYTAEQGKAPPNLFRLNVLAVTLSNLDPTTVKQVIQVIPP